MAAGKPFIPAGGAQGDGNKEVLFGKLNDSGNHRGNKQIEQQRSPAAPVQGEVDHQQMGQDLKTVVDLIAEKMRRDIRQCVFRKAEKKYGDKGGKTGSNCPVKNLLRQKKASSSSQLIEISQMKISQHENIDYAVQHNRPKQRFACNKRQPVQQACQSGEEQDRGAAKRMRQAK